MGYIYKLVDENELNNAKKNIISFSRPIFEFMGSEGNILNFVKRISKKYNDKEKRLNIKPSAKDLDEIVNWMKIFKETYGDDLNDLDMITDSKIMFCLYMQTYCGYFTNVNLFNENVRREFLSKSRLKKKIAVIRIDEEKLNHLHWQSKKVEGPFIKFYGSDDSISDFNCYLHIFNVEYSQNFKDYETLLKRYNANVRYIHTWFDLLSKEYDWQNEKRLIITLNSFEINTAKRACNKAYSRTSDNSLQYLLYCNLMDAIDYGCKGPKYINFQLDDGDIEILSLY